MLEFVVISAMAARSESICYTKLVEQTKVSEEKIALILMRCNVKMIEGENYLLNPEMHTLRMNLYPRDEAVDMGHVEKAHRILFYNECKQITKLVNDFMDRCRGVK